MSRDKREVFDELIQEVRRSQEATQRFDEAVAEAAGVNLTDMRCLEVLGLEGPVTAGRLAEATGLTSGAMTTALDRLERHGYARRVRDTADRRRVLVEITPLAIDGAGRFYGEQMAHSERLYARYTKPQLELLLEFVREGRELNERTAAKLEAQTRGQDGAP
ncbi:MAG TPA: MarR family transcriptional regulator [Solirubrobacteraceae bacterium]